MGERRPVDAAEIQWNIPAPTWRNRLKRAQPQVGLLRDVSVTGAAIRAPQDASLGRGAIVNVAYGWVDGTVRVKRVDADGNRTAIYGVEFDHTDSPLARAVHNAHLTSRPVADDYGESDDSEMAGEPDEDIDGEEPSAEA